MGQAGTGAEAAAPCKICSITPLRKREKGWEGRRQISRHGWVHSSPAYTSQSCHRGGGDKLGGGWLVLRRDKPFRQACFTPSTSDGRAHLRAIEKAASARSHRRTPMTLSPCACQTSRLCDDTFLWMPSPKAKLMSLKRLPLASPSPPQCPSTRLS